MEKYTVSHQVVQFLYFESDDQLPSGVAYAQLWEGLERLGRRRVSGAFWRLGEVSQAKVRRVRLGDPRFLDNQQPLNECPLFGGGCDTRRDAAIPHRDSDFYLELNTSSRSNTGRALPKFTMAVSDDWLSSLSAAKLLEILHDNFALLDEAGPPYGFIEVSAAADTYAGGAYSPVSFLNVPLRRFVDEARWARSVDAGEDRVRSIYWGNYFGRRLLEKLGGKTEFIEAYRGQITSPNGSERGVIWDFPNGVFVSLTPDPRDLAPGRDCFVAEGNMLWLYNQLEEADAI